MDKPFIPSSIIPPGINDERSRALVSAYSQELEQVELSDLLVNDAMTVDARLLPAMTVARTMTDFTFLDMREDHLRRLLDDYREIHANSGYIKGVRRALAAFNVTVSWTQWFHEEPKAEPNTHKVVAFVNENLFAGETGLLDAKTQAAILNVIDLTKRWSQDISFSLGVGFNQNFGLANALSSMVMDKRSLEAKRPSDFKTTIGIANAFAGLQVMQATFAN